MSRAITSIVPLVRPSPKFRNDRAAHNAVHFYRGTSQKHAISERLNNSATVNTSHTRVSRASARLRRICVLCIAPTRNASYSTPKFAQITPVMPLGNGW